MLTPTQVSHVSIALIEDHGLVRSAFSKLIDGSTRFRVSIEAGNGIEFLLMLDSIASPDIIILDIEMPIMNGLETMKALNQRLKNHKVLILTALSDEISIIKLHKLGIKGYIMKSVEPHDFFLALDKIAAGETYFPDIINNTLINTSKQEFNKKIESLKEKELLFLKYAATDIPYKDIANKMLLSRHTIDDYRNSLYEKFAVKSRIGLVLLAQKFKIV